jgi:hypothetical protein
VVPFNFGGPQPETTYPLPADAEPAFNYAGSGSWESTRNLSLSARDGFLPWVIVAGVAPRRLIYAHEFAWDQEHDPVWSRLQKIYHFYNAADSLAAAHGHGKLSGQPPESSHCTNIGPEHRKMIYPTLQRWFGIPEPVQESRQHRTAEELTCLTPAVAGERKPRPLHQLAAELGAERSAAARRRLAGLSPEARRQQLRRDWTRLLGDVEPAGKPKVLHRADQAIGAARLERIVLEVEPEVRVPLLLLLPQKRDTRLSVVIGFAQEGKQAFLKQRPEVLAELLAGGTAVCLPDLRGTGETAPGSGRGRTSSATAISATEWMLGRTLLGLRLRDLRAVLLYLRTRPELDPARLALWGDSFAPTNPMGRNLEVPLDAEPFPKECEPLGGLLALFGALFEEDVRAVYAQGGMASYASVLDSPFCYVPHDALVPGARTAGDLSDVAAALAPRPLRLAGLVDGLNRPVSAEAAAGIYAAARDAYRNAAAGNRFLLEPGGRGDAIAGWLQLR